jgi:hypothetical protein
MLSMVARARPVGVSMVVRARGQGSWLRAQEATPCHRGALGGDDEVDPRPVDGGVPTVVEGTRCWPCVLLVVDGLALGAAPFEGAHWT